MQIGYKLAAEAFGPQELVRQAVLAESAGFDFVEMSDHYRPWLDVQGQSRHGHGSVTARDGTRGRTVFGVNAGRAGRAR